MKQLLVRYATLAVNTLFTQFNKLNQMEKPITTTNGAKLIEFLDKKMYQGEFTNDDLIQFIESVAKYLNLQTIADYANEHKMSYNGVKNNRNIQKICNVNFVIENH